MAMNPTTSTATWSILSSTSRLQPSNNPSIIHKSNHKKPSKHAKTRLAITRATISIDKTYDRQAFDDSKDGVKGVADKGLKTIPHIFIHSPEFMSEYLGKTGSNSVPVLDFSGVEESVSRRAEIVEEVARVSGEIGLFQIINHGIPVELLESTLKSITGFHEQPVEMKAPFYNRDMKRGSSYYSNVDVFNYAKPCHWGDTLRVKGPPRPQEIPEICRNEVVESYKAITKLARVLMSLLCEGLGINAEAFNHLTDSEVWTIVGLYYPPCPQPHLTVGQVAHTDPGFFTLLYQDQVGGLQVKHGQEWVDVEPIRGAIVMNVGDVFQILSNDRYLSADHRVLANKTDRARTSVAYFFRPTNMDSVYGPLQNLISEESPKRYREFTLTDFLIRFVTQNFEGKGNLLNYYKI